MFVPEHDEAKNLRSVFWFKSNADQTCIVPKKKKLNIEKQANTTKNTENKHISYK